VLSLQSTVELRDPTLGRIFARKWSLGAIKDVRQIEEKGLSADEYVARLFALISRVVSEEAPLDSDAFQAGTVIDLSLLQQLSPERLDALAQQYLEKAAESIIGPATDESTSQSDPTPRPGERQTERLRRIVKSSLAMRVTQRASMLIPGVSITLSDALKRTDLLTGDLQDAISAFKKESVGSAEKLQQFGKSAAADIASRMTGPSLREFDPTDFPKLPPNPIYETNAQISQLTTQISHLLEIAQRQAELSQALTETSQLALEESIAAGRVAGDALRQSRNGVRIALATLILSLVVSVGSMIVTYRTSSSSSSSTDARLERLITSIESLRSTITANNARDVSLREQELRVLQEIERLQRDLKKPIPSKR